MDATSAVGHRIVHGGEKIFQSMLISPDRGGRPPGALVFTAGIGEHSPVVRERICRGLGVLGVEIDPAKNQAARGEADLSAPAL